MDKNTLKAVLARRGILNKVEHFMVKDGCYIHKDAYVCADTKVLRGSVITSGAWVTTSTISNSLVVDGVVSRSMVENTKVIRATIRNSAVSESFLYDDVVATRSTIVDASLRCGTRVDDATLTGVLLRYGNITGGTWTSTPTVVLPPGRRYCVCNSAPGMVTIGCTTLTIEEWLGSAGRKIAREQLIPSKDRAAYRAAINYIKEVGR